ncbi:MAG: hypothetical protein ACREQ4_14165 [Candidatus Binataceae bacterium]
MRELVNGKTIFNDKGEQTGFEDGYVQKAQKLRERYHALQSERAAPPRQEAQPQRAPEKTAAAERQAPTPTPRSRQTGPDRLKELIDDINEPQKEKDPEKQQELDRKLKRDRER